MHVVAFRLAHRPRILPLLLRKVMQEKKEAGGARI